VHPHTFSNAEIEKKNTSPCASFTFGSIFGAEKSIYNYRVEISHPDGIENNDLKRAENNRDFCICVLLLV